MKTNLRPYCVVEPERVQQNVEHCKGLGLPYVSSGPRPRLAVVGGGPSILDHIETLQEWDGDIWACGSAFAWCLAHGIEATYFCIDPQVYDESLTKGATKAILATCSDPSAFEFLRNAEVEVFDLVHGEESSNHGVTTMTAAPELSITMGYRDVTFFGADSSFVNQSHAYHDAPSQYKMIIRVGNESFLTDAELFMQAELMAHIVRLAPHVFKEQSGGLLRAMVADLDYDVTHVSEHFMEQQKAA